MSLTIDNIKYCYNTIKINRDEMGMFTLGKHLGYLEAGLMIYDRLETIYDEESKSNTIKVNIIKNNKWWKKDKVETYEQAIIRMTENLINDENKKII